MSAIKLLKLAVCLYALAVMGFGVAVYRDITGADSNEKPCDIERTQRQEQAERVTVALLNSQR